MRHDHDERDTTTSHDAFGDVVLGELTITLGTGPHPDQPLDAVLAAVQASLAEHDVIATRQERHLVLVGTSSAVMDAVEHAHRVARLASASAEAEVRFAPALPSSPRRRPAWGPRAGARPTAAGASAPV